MGLRFVNIFLPFAVACSYSDYAFLEAQSLTVMPCKDHGPRTFSPFRIYADLLRWFGAEGVGTIEARRGFRAATTSDAIIIQFADVEQILKGLAEDPDRYYEVDGKKIRVSLVLAETCPDATQPVVGTGHLSFSVFEPWKGGHIAGGGKVSLYDARKEAEAAGSGLIVKDATLAFSMKVRSGPPHEEFTLWP